jgi:hypothetical protein
MQMGICKIELNSKVSARVSGILMAAGLLLCVAPANATTNSQERQAARDVRQDTRPAARQEKHECRQANEKSNSQCRQDKRGSKQDARQTGRDIKY